MTTHLAEFRVAHPDVFYLDRGEIGALERYLQQHGILPSGERILSAERAGDGNMNCTLRVTTWSGSWVVKQARPWVEKYPQFAAPWDRAIREAEFYRLISSRPAVAGLMPRLLFCDPEARVLVLEDLGAAADYTGVYRGEKFTPADVRQLAEFLAQLHAPFESAKKNGASSGPHLANREMRTLNHAHIFTIPLTPDNGLDLDRLTPGLAEVGRVLQADLELRREVEKLGRDYYLADGPSLLHGDFFPGSLLRTAAGPRIIDPEFGFFGRREFDAAVFLAHLHLASQPPALATAFRRTYESPGPFDDDLMRQFAGVEILRRLIGFAQLPLGCTLDRKRELLELARALVLKPGPGQLAPGI